MNNRHAKPNSRTVDGTWTTQEIKHTAYPTNDYEQGFRVRRNANTLHVTIVYPPRGADNEVLRDGRKVTDIRIGLEHCRATDDIRIFYHFGRNGWVVMQQRELTAEERDAGEIEEIWTEVAFLESYALQPHVGDG